MCQQKETAKLAQKNAFLGAMLNIIKEIIILRQN